MMMMNKEYQMDVASGFVFLIMVLIAFIAMAVGGYAFARRFGSSPLSMFLPTQRGLVIHSLRSPVMDNYGHSGVIWFYADVETARLMRGYGRVQNGRIDEQTGVMLYSLAVSQFVSFDSVYAEVCDLALRLCPHQTLPELRINRNRENRMVNQ